MTPTSLDFITCIRLFQKRIHATAVSKGWWNEAGNDGEKIALMHSELSEGLEALRRNLMSDHIPEFQGIEEELADTVIRILDYAGARGLRIPEAMLAKADYNEGREYQHGGKKF